MKNALAAAGLALLCTLPLHAQTVRTEIVGVSGEMAANVRAAVGLKQAEQLEKVSVWRLRRLSLEAREEVRNALKPFGYYSANVNVRLDEPDQPGAPWRARIEIAPGEPVRVTEAHIDLGTTSDEIEAFTEWLENWPLPPGSALRHPPWTRALADLEQLARLHGFFDARFAARRMEVAPARNEAVLTVDYEPGRRYRIGRIDFGNSGFNDDLMRAQTILETDQPFVAEDLDEQRQTLVRTGYFDQVAIEQQRNRDDATVDLVYRLERRKPSTWRVLAGFGTDTGARGQVGLRRHYLSARGDRLDVGVGAQQTNSEFVLRGTYEHPFGGEPGNFLFTDVLLKRENDRFRFEDEDRIEPVFEAFSGDRTQMRLAVGRLRERRLLKRPFQPLIERLFVLFLNEQFDAFSRSSISDEQLALLRANPGLRPFLDTDTNTVALGGEWTLSRMVGERFATEGLHAQARVLGSVEQLGSDTSFLQGYAQGRWHWRFLPRHKVLLRGELGYTAADTTTLNLRLPGDERQLDLDITELPELFRFKTGGDRTVRGYSYEALSTNRNGANHLMVGSVEYEYNIYGDFSLAGFYDIGNAFNDFANPELKRGAGAGVRWYTLIGPVQLDFARALDDDTWTIHFTIGSKLL
ncbi:MAG: BamA/TamA family outer membrane protein [Wenzhouxiangellaceae bacterium]|nr:BamA/TamA family outer membrane protein [Wenzhouxiangellaceae bacterium]